MKGSVKRFFSSLKSQSKFLVYFMVVNLLAAGTVGLLLYFRTSDTIKQQTVEYNKNMLVQIIKSVDVLVNMVDQFTNQIPSDRDIIELPRLLNSPNSSQLIPVNEKMNYLLNSNTDIYDIAMYYTKENKVFEVNNRIINLDDYIYKDILMSNISEPLKMKVVPSFGVVDKRNSSRKINTVSIIKPIPMNGSKPYAYVIVVIGERFFTNILNSISNNNGTEIYITNTEGDIISRSQLNGEYDELLTKDYTKDFSTKQIENKTDNFKGGDVFVSVATSDIYGWKFISITPYSRISEKINIIKNYVIIVSLLAFLLGIFASFYFSNRISNPLNDIISLFNNSSGGDREGDVFKYIEKNVNQLVMNKASIENILSEHMPILRNNYLTGMLFGFNTIRDEIENRFNYYGIHLEMDGAYLVTVIQLGHDANGAEQYTERQINMMLIYMIGTIEEIINKEENNGMVINTRPDELAILLRQDSSMDKVETRICVAELCSQIKKSIFEKTSCDMIMAVSDVGHDISQISIAYTEAIEALEYNKFDRASDIIFYEDIKNLKEDNFSYPIIMEEALFSALRQGNAQEVREQCHSLICEFSNGHLRSNKIMVYNMQLLSSTIRFVYEFGLNIESEWDESKLYKELLECSNKHDVKQWFERLFNKLLSSIEQRKGSKNRSIIDKVVKYINENCEKELSLTILSEMVHMSPNYFGKIFKEETGVPIKQYINGIRIERAKELLKNPKIKIAEVAAAVGYDKMMSFLYLFKEGTGMTPGEYRGTVLNTEENKE